MRAALCFALVTLALGCNSLAGLGDLQFEGAAGAGEGGSGAGQASGGSSTTGGGGVGEGGGSVGGTGGSGGSQGFDFFDDFDRADDGQLGNGWLEKSPAAYELIGSEASKAAVSSGYRDNLCYRPASEDVLDVEASVEFTLAGLPIGNPQIFVRGQSASIAVSGGYDGYLFWLGDSGGEVNLARQRGSAFALELEKLVISPPLNFTDRYRFRLKATGTDPVTLEAAIDRFGGQDWQTLVSTTYLDQDAMRVASPGTVGFSGDLENGWVLDNFARDDL